jgi:hypothetical protein
MTQELGIVKPGRRWRNILGWIAVALSTALSSMWAFWGIVENFHEGWYYRNVASNLGLMFAQYLSVMLILMMLSLLAIRWPRVGSVFHLLLAIGLLYLLRTSYTTALPLIAAPFMLLGFQGRERCRLASVVRQTDCNL